MNNSCLSKNIEAALKRKGWSRYRLAKESGMNQMTIGNICNGVHEPGVWKVARIAKTLGVSVNSLISENF